MPDVRYIVEPTGVNREGGVKMKLSTGVTPVSSPTQRRLGSTPAGNVPRNAVPPTVPTSSAAAMAPRAGIIDALLPSASAVPIHVPVAGVVATKYSRSVAARRLRGSEGPPSFRSATRKG